VRALLAAAAITAAAVAPAAPAQAAPVLTVWVHPAGSDTNTGTSPSAPFATLQRASDWLCGSTASCAGRGQPVEVRIAQKVIPVKGMTTWRYYDPASPTTLEPWSYQPGDGWAQVAAHGGYPAFDGGFNVTTGLRVTGTGSTRLAFRYLRWQRFLESAVTLDGAGGVTFYGDYFTQTGNWWRPAARLGYGAVVTSHSSGDVFRNSHFVQIQNTQARGDALHIHALYLTHGSSGTVVQGNEFTAVNGDVVRQRDRSDNTLVTQNTFTKAGALAYADDWYCRPGTGCSPVESRSFGGVFRGNTLRGLYPEGLTGRRIAYCYDQPRGACPANRWAVS
jgi:hypothetical protein